MKRLFCLMLALICLLATGCSFPGTSDSDTVLFYYPLKEFDYSAPGGVIQSEERDMPGHGQDIPYLLTMYLLGPEKETLNYPFPKNTAFSALEHDENTIIITLKDTGAAMTEIQYTLACACLVKTCLGITDADRFVINMGQRSLSMNRDTLILFDSVATETTES